METEGASCVLQTAVSYDIAIISKVFRCLHFHPNSSEAVSVWSGGNPGLLGPAGGMLILTWIHAHSHAHTHMLTKKVILVAESCGVWFVFCSFTGNRYVCVDSLLFLFRVCSLNVVMVVGLHGMIRHTEIAIIRAIIIKFLAPIMMLTTLVVMMKMLMTMVMTILPIKNEK